MNEQPMEMSGNAEKPLVSVVIPVYNVEKYLSECLDSVIGQTLREIEIICVNDGSTDSSAAIAEEYVRKDSRVKLISQPNGGLSAARNTGMKAARGEYVAFLDSDDCLTENALEKLYRQSRDEGLDILYFGAESFYENEELRKANEKLEAYYHRKKTDGAVDHEEAMKLFMKEDSYRASVPLQFFRRAFLEENGLSFWEGIVHEDELFTPQALARADKVAVTDGCYYRRRVRAGSIMTMPPSVERYNGRFTVAMKLLTEAMSFGGEQENVRKFLYERGRVMYARAKETYLLLSDREKKHVLTYAPEELRFLFGEIDYPHGASGGKEVMQVRKSPEYRLGAFITWLPRKLRELRNRKKSRKTPGQQSDA